MSPHDLPSNLRDSGALQFEMPCRKPSSHSAAERNRGVAAAPVRRWSRLCRLISEIAASLSRAIGRRRSLKPSLGCEDGGTQDLSCPQLCKDLVGFNERE